MRTDDTHPLYQGSIDTDRMYENIVNEFQWGGMDDSVGVYLDENNLRMITNMRLQMANLGEALIEENQEERAKEVMDLALKAMPEHNVPYDQIIFQYVKNYYAMTVDSTTLGMPPGTPPSNLSAEAFEEARETGASLLLRLFELQEDELEYYATLDANHSMQWRQHMNLNLDLNQSMIDVLRIYDPTSPLIDSLQTRLEEQVDLFEGQEEKMRGTRSSGPFEF